MANRLRPTFIWNQGALAAAIAAAGMLASDAGDGDKTVAGTETLTRSMAYDELIVPSGAILIARSCRIFARRVHVQAGGIIHVDGAAGSGFTAGAAFSAIDIGANIAGGNGSVSGAATAGSNTSSLMVPRSGSLDSAVNYRGGAGGSGNGGANAGGAAGTVGASSSGRQIRFGGFLSGVGIGSTLAANTGGSGGGGGGGSGSVAGGGGGAGGGVGIIIAGEVVNEGIIRAAGGAGVAGLGNNAGGGGGGGGGCWAIFCGRYSGDVPTCPGGVGGASGGGTGVAGSDGKPGDYHIFTRKS